MDDRASAESMDGSERKIWVMISVGSASKYIAVVLDGVVVLWCFVLFHWSLSFLSFDDVTLLLKLLLID